jgi:hypothetical protein
VPFEAPHIDDLDPFDSLRAATTDIDDLAIGRARGVAGDDEPVGGRSIAAKLGLDDQRATIAGVVAVDRQCADRVARRNRTVARRCADLAVGCSRPPA